jgi:ketosteroid isomerase-like protein
MGHREAMLDVIKRAYGARDGGDLEGLMDAFHSDAVFTLAGDQRSLDIAGSLRGHGEVKQAMRGFIASFQFVERTILSELVEGDRAAVHSRLVVRFLPTGDTRNVDVLDLFTFEAGKIVELVEFADTAQIRDMMSVAPAGKVA